MTAARARSAGVGAQHLGASRCAFRVWVPDAEAVELRLLSPRRRTIPLLPIGGGYFGAVVDGVPPDSRYFLGVDGGPDRPDPASRAQPDGVHGPSAVVPTAYDWRNENWRGVAIEDLVIYEIHIGTFTTEGTFDAAAAYLPALRDLGITAVELMPVAQFPGTRNWGYDGVFPFAVQNSYGGAHALKRFVDRCHAHGIAVVLDVVYNHLGPEGNVLADFGPYFTDRYGTPWGEAVNFDGRGSDDVREYFILNALQWVDEFRIDALRLDAVHAIVDATATPFLAELAERVAAAARSTGRHVHLIAESDLADPRLVRAATDCGIGLDGQWLDDFHHALHALLTGERVGYYADYGTIEKLGACLRNGFANPGGYSIYHGRRHGAPSHDIAPARFVVYAQNHDQVGNRRAGDRLSRLVSPDRLRLAAAVTLLSPFTPLLFMGEEYGETAPFPFFISHGDDALVEAVRRGRREEFAAFGWPGDSPDPQDERTFRSAVLRHDRREEPAGAAILAMHRQLIALRRELPRPARMDDPAYDVTIDAGGETIILTHERDGAAAVLALHFGRAPLEVEVPLSGSWLRRFDSADERWDGPGSLMNDAIDAAGGCLRLDLQPFSAALLTRAAEA
jgi:maltooligosyltrehalose trehalohydrolase